MPQVGVVGAQLPGPKRRYEFGVGATMASRSGRSSTTPAIAARPTLESTPGSSVSIGLPSMVE
jgi:hypothetical protein